MCWDWAGGEYTQRKTPLLRGEGEGRVAVCAHVCRLVLMYAFVCVFKPKDDLGYHFIDGICPSFVSLAVVKS